MARKIESETARERLARFYAKTVRSSSSDCIIWNACKDKDGYGWFIFRPFTQVYAHRSAWMIHRGEIPPGLQVLHSCDQPSCVNIDHLYLGTNLDNMADKVRKNRQSITGRPRQTHCQRGHELTGDNLIIKPRSGGNGVLRNCKKCLKKQY